MEDALSAALSRWRVEARVADSIAARDAGHWQRQQATDEASFSGLLLDLVEQQAAVAMETSWGVLHVGALVGIGHDHVAIAPIGRPPVVLQLGSVTSVRVDDLALARRVPSARPLPEDSPTLGEVLAPLAAQRAKVTYRTSASGGRRTAELRAVASDMAILEEPASGTTHYVPLHHLQELTLAPGP